jgi:hypothetical protein
MIPAQWTRRFVGRLTEGGYRGAGGKMRFLALAVTAAVAPASLRAQATPPARWSLTVAAEGVRFGQTARERLEVSGGRIGLRPSGRIGGHVAIERSFGPWRVHLGAGWAGGDAEATNEAVSIRDKTLDLSRYRVAPALERRIAALGGGELAAGLGPTIDLWRSGGDTRPRLGIEARAAVRLPLGRMALENRVAFGLSGAPLEREELEEEFELRTLRALAFAVGLRMPL